MTTDIRFLGMETAKEYYSRRAGEERRYAQEAKHPDRRRAYLEYASLLQKKADECPDPDRPQQSEFRLD